MEKETFKFQFNGVEYPNRLTMEDAIALCREKAMAGRNVALYCLSARGWTKLGEYHPDPMSPHFIFDNKTGQIIEEVPYCAASPKPLANYPEL